MRGSGLLLRASAAGRRITAATPQAISTSAARPNIPPPQRNRLKPRLPIGDVSDAFVHSFHRFHSGLR
jgi:hypothetical protein